MPPPSDDKEVPQSGTALPGQEVPDFIQEEGNWFENMLKNIEEVFGISPLEEEPDSQDRLAQALLSDFPEDSQNFTYVLDVIPGNPQDVLSRSVTKNQNAFAEDQVLARSEATSSLSGAIPCDVPIGSEPPCKDVTVTINGANPIGASLNVTLGGLIVGFGITNNIVIETFSAQEGANLVLSYVCIFPGGGGLQCISSGDTFVGLNCPGAGGIPEGHGTDGNINNFNCTVC